jgi:rhodanese-related sulfurtransferase
METITVDELEQMKDSGSDFRLVDVLGEEHYENGHIPGAENIPLNQVAETALEEIGKDEEIVVYCKDEDCQASPKAAEKLEKLGYENVKDFEGGLKAWEEAGNSVES